MAEKVGRRLRADGFRGRTVGVVLRYADFKTLLRYRTVSEAMDEGDRIYRVAWHIFERVYRKGRPVRMLGVVVSNLSYGNGQLPLLEEDRRSWSLVQALDRINDRFGEFTIAPGRLLMHPIQRRHYQLKRSPLKHHAIRVAGCLR
jgi:DNA polymerase-4